MTTDQTSKILVVDDEEIIREIVSRSVAEVGCECSTATDAADALAMLSEEAADLILLDIILPDKSGMELLPEIRERYQGTAIVMMTGVADINIGIQAMRQGALDYVVKPFDLAELRNRVADALATGRDKRDWSQVAEHLARYGKSEVEVRQACATALEAARTQSEFVARMSKKDLLRAFTAALDLGETIVEHPPTVVEPDMPEDQSPLSILLADNNNNGASIQSYLNKARQRRDSS